MGLFSKKKGNKNSNSVINEAISMQVKLMQDNIDRLKCADSIQNLEDRLEVAITSIKKLGDMTKQYNAKLVGFDEDELVSALQNDVPEIERIMIDNWINNLDRKILNYTTEKGKKSNFIKEVEKFRFDYNKLDKTSIDYFEKKVSEKYSEYL